jgi:hypothetical protein
MGMAAATVAVALAATAGSASAFGGDGHGVFVQTDNLAGNQVIAYDRAPDGTLTQAGTYATGGLGGQLTGSVADHLASQGSLVADRQARLLYAVNAGSNTVSVFAVDGDRLALRQVIGSGGTFPVSIAVRHGLVYVLNARDGGSLQGFVRIGERLFALPGSDRPLGLDPTATPEFVNTPGQVAFSRDGSQLVVTTKANGNDVDVFGVQRFGLLSAAPTVNALPGAVPFGISSGRDGDLVIAEAGTDAVATFALQGDGTIQALASVSTGQKATCWVVRTGDRYYASNAGSGTLTGIQGGPDGALSVLGQTATDPGTVDAAATRDGRYVYAQTGVNGIVDEFAVNADGSLTAIGSVVVPGGAGGEGIVAG